MEVQHLGSFVHDATLNERVNDLFKSGQDIFLVNASAYEDLCQNWGFYFRSGAGTADLGSLDLKCSHTRAYQLDEYFNPLRERLPPNENTLIHGLKQNGK